MGLVKVIADKRSPTTVGKAALPATIVAMATKAERLILIEAKAGLVASEQLQGRQRILGLEGQDPRVQLIELPSPA